MAGGHDRPGEGELIVNSLTLLHIAKRDLGLDEDDYRSVLERATGKHSARDLDAAELDRALAEFKRLGFKQSSKGVRKRLKGRFAKKLQALWIAGWNLGVVKNRDDRSLLAFVKRQTGLDHTRFLHHAEDAARAIEALKAWLAREAGVDWSVEPDAPPHTRLAGYRIARAQYEIFGPDAMPAMKRYQFISAVGLVTGKDTRQLPAEADWIAVMNAFGKRVREAKKARTA